MEMLSNFLPEKKLLPKEVYVEDEKCSLWISLALRLADLEMLEGADLFVTAWPHPHMGGISTQWLPAGLESHQPTKFQVFCGWKTLQRFQKIMEAVRCGGFSCEVKWDACDRNAHPVPLFFLLPKVGIRRIRN